MRPPSSGGRRPGADPRRHQLPQILEVSSDDLILADRQAEARLPERRARTDVAGALGGLRRDPLARQVRQTAQSGE